jgi:hypothetical protein
LIHGGAMRLAVLTPLLNHLAYHGGSGLNVLFQRIFIV